MSESKEHCIICYENLSKDDKKQSCGHRFHQKCLEKHFKPECPLCRAKLDFIPKGTPPDSFLPTSLNESNDQPYYRYESFVFPLPIPQSQYRSVDMNQYRSVDMNQYRSVDMTSLYPLYANVNVKNIILNNEDSDTEDEIEYEDVDNSGFTRQQNARRNRLVGNIIEKNWPN